jgi:hypothetical protein
VGAEGSFHWQDEIVAQLVRLLTTAILSQLVRELAGSVLSQSVAEFDSQRPGGIETEQTGLYFVRKTY